MYCLNWNGSIGSQVLMTLPVGGASVVTNEQTLGAGKTQFHKWLPRRAASDDGDTNE